MKKVTLLLSAFIAVVGIASAPLLLADSAYAVGAADSIKEGIDKTGGQDNKTELPDYIKIVSNVLLFILGAIAVIMIIIGGIRYTTSNGDASQTKSAKDTILYAVVGLVVAILAYAIVNFVVNSFAKA